MLITIDGFSCQGKSFFGKQVAKELGLSFFSTGLLVRFIAYQYRISDIRESDPLQAIQKALDVFEKTDVNDIIAHTALRDFETEKYLEDIAGYPFIMPVLQRKLKDYVKGKNILLDGRFTFDIFPEADKKYYFQSSVQNRIELTARGKRLSFEDAKKYVQYRDSFEPSVVIPDSVLIIDPFSFQDNKLLDFLIEDIKR